jgi:hypothetical protein
MVDNGDDRPAPAGPGRPGGRPELTAARSYIAGIGASGALVGATVLAVVLLGALLAFEGFPIAGDDGSADSIRVGAGENSIGVATAAAVGAAPGAVAAAPGAAAGGAAAGGGGGAADAGAPGTAPPGATGTDGSVPPGAPPTGPTAPPTGAPPAPPGVPANPITDTLSGVDSAVEAETGIDPNLGGATEPVTGAVDQVLENTTGNDLGGHVDNVTDGLPGN